MKPYIEIIGIKGSQKPVSLHFQEARQPTANERLQQSVFGLLTPEEIKERVWCSELLV